MDFCLTKKERNQIRRRGGMKKKKKGMWLVWN